MDPQGRLRPHMGARGARSCHVAVYGGYCACLRSITPSAALPRPALECKPATPSQRAACSLPAWQKLKTAAHRCFYAGCF
jgi:hypothetical protein